MAEASRGSERPTIELVVPTLNSHALLPRLVRYTGSEPLS